MTLHSLPQSPARPRHPRSPWPQPAPDYAELQAISNFSFLRGGSHPHELVAQAKALGLSALGIADHNTLAGVVRAHVAAKEAGLRLLIGARLDLADAPGLICYPADRQAYGRLCRLLSLGQGRAGKGQCHLTLADVAASAQGQVLIVVPSDDWDWRGAGGLVEDELASGKTGQRKRHERAGCLVGNRRRQQNVAWQVGLAPPPIGGHPRAPVFFDTNKKEGVWGTRPPTEREAVLEARVFDTTLAREATCSLEADLQRIKAACTGARLYLAASHTCRGDDRARIRALGLLAMRTGLTLVATGGALYHAPARRPLQDVLTCIRHGVTIETAGFRLEANAERHLKTPAAMARLFHGAEAALAATIEITEACRFSLDELVYEYPDEPIPPGKTAQGHLEDLAREGARRRFPGGVPPEVAATLVRELALITALNYAPYFLTVYDIVAFARSQSILAQGRGSAANSAVCYCLGITAVNPTEVDLLFERFISPERREPPDIDVDFEHERREEVIQYIYARYGRDRAGLAATVISYRARSAVREVGRAMGLTADTVAALAGMVWGTRSGDALPEPHVREAGLDPGDPLLAAVLTLTQELIGFPRHLSQHVGGFVLTRGPLIEVVPVGNAAMKDRTFIEWDKDDIAALGLLKIDVLALGMLSCIRRAFDCIAEHYAPPFRTPAARPTLATVPREDPAVYDMLCRADSIGVFQVESRAQMNMLPRLKPRTFYDLVIEVAIVRPGPIQGDMVHPYLRRRDGIEPESYPSPAPGRGDPDELRRILAKTKGVPLFQEQAMRIAMTAAEFSDGEVNELRKAMATFRRRGTIGLLEEKMISRMVGRGYEQAFAERCFNQIKGFGEYGFPESHAASFAHLVYVSAWLKCHYPAAFAAALLNAQPMGFYAPAQIVRDAREHGVEAHGPDVNHSDWEATLEATALPNRPALRLGLRQIDGLQREEAEKVSGSRCQGSRASEVPGVRCQGPGQKENRHLIPETWNLKPETSFTSLHDLRQRTGLRIDTLERLAAADAFRSLGLDRRQALWEVKALSNAAPLPLFAWSETRDTGAEPAVTLPAMPLSEHVVNDYQTLRLSLKAHPMHFLRAGFTARRVCACAGLASLRDGANVAVAGVILVRQRPGSAKGVVFMTIEDETGIANAVIWPKTLERYRRAVMGARLILIRGRIQRHESIIHVVAATLEDQSHLLATLVEGGDGEPDMPAAVRRPIPMADASMANTGEVRRPEPGLDATVSRRHPRDVRIIPKSRDFH